MAAFNWTFVLSCAELHDTKEWHLWCELRECHNNNYIGSKVMMPLSAVTQLN